MSSRLASKEENRAPHKKCPIGVRNGQVNKQMNELGITNMLFFLVQVANVFLICFNKPSSYQVVLNHQAF